MKPIASWEEHTAGQTLTPHEERYGALSVSLYHLDSLPILPGEVIEAWQSGYWLPVRYAHEEERGGGMLVFADPRTGEYILLPGDTRFRWPASEIERRCKSKGRRPTVWP